MSLINSRDRNVRIVATAATILLGLSIASTAQADPHGGHGAGHNTASSYDPAKSVIRDHRKPAGNKPATNGASAVPTGWQR
jgi:hypothetical protein